MTHDAPFTVATLGLDERDRIMLRDLLRLSERRSPSYHMHSGSAEQLPHILIVNADRPEVLAKWRAFRNARQDRYRCSDVLLSSAPPAASAKYGLTRPATVTQLFETLDQAVAADHGYQGAPGSNDPRPFLVLSTHELAPAAARAPAAPPVLLTPAVETPLVATPPVAAPPLATPSVATPSAATPPAAPTPNPDEVAVIMEIPVSSPAQIDALLNGVASLAPAAPAAIPGAAVAAPVSPQEAKQAAAQARVTPTNERAAPVLASKARILVVDDSLPVRIQMKNALQGYAAAIDFADTGEQAMLLLDNRKYDVIFLDVILPGKDGYEVCRYIRRHPRQRKTPVIMLTGNSMPADRVKGKMAGCDTYLIKPVRQSVLTEVIADFIKTPDAAA